MQIPKKYRIIKNTEIHFIITTTKNKKTFQNNFAKKQKQLKREHNLMNQI